MPEGAITTTSRADDSTAPIRSPPLEAELVPVTETVFAACGESFGANPVPVVFSKLANGSPCVYIGMRATPKTS
ncbi:hypothetical protein ACFXI3_31330 [Amycolatopsis sp. NPDC059235]|uniref:hypothetical protein n=1 Tax=Amycolatopsis sp. NPDC059235 TaxID=3346782 RepID=UPI003672BB58